VHSTFTEKLQINEQIKLYTIYTNTTDRQRELAGRTNYHIYIFSWILCGYRFCLFLRFWYFILELFAQCCIFRFSFCYDS